MFSNCASALEGPKLCSAYWGKYMGTIYRSFRSSAAFLEIFDTKVDHKVVRDEGCKKEVFGESLSTSSNVLEISWGTGWNVGKSIFDKIS